MGVLNRYPNRYLPIPFMYGLMLAEGHAPHFHKPDSISSCNFGPRKFTNEVLNVLPVSHFLMGKYSKSTKEEQAGIRKLCQHLLETPTQGPELKELARKAKPGQAREKHTVSKQPRVDRRSALHQNGTASETLIISDSVSENSINSKPSQPIGGHPIWTWPIPHEHNFDGIPSISSIVLPVEERL